MDVDWINLAQERNKWRVLLNVVCNIRVPKLREISWLAKELSGFQEELRSHGLYFFV
jgi:hypothetical protein